MGAGSLDFIPLGIDDLAQVFFMRIELTLDQQKLQETLSGLAPGQHGLTSIGGSIAVVARIDLSLSGVLALSGQLFGVLPGFAVEAATTATIVAVDTAAPAVAGETIAATGGPVIQVTMIGVFITDSLNTVLADARHNSERQGRCPYLCAWVPAPGLF